MMGLSSNKVQNRLREKLESKTLKKQIIMEVTLFVLVIAIGIYKIVELSLNRFERLKAMQKLEGQDLVEYLGKAAPQEDSLKASMWWLMRIGSILIGVGIGFLQCIWIEQLPAGRYNNTPIVVLSGAMMLGGALFLVVELLIERKLRK